MCAFYQKYGSFWEKNIVHLFVRFFAKLGAPLSSELLNTLGLCSYFLINRIPTALLASVVEKTKNASEFLENENNV